MAAWCTSTNPAADGRVADNPILVWLRVSRVPGWITSALLTLGTLLLRLPLLTPRLAHWDAVNYAPGLHDFNLAAHPPHPPGSPYLFLLGPAARAAGGCATAPPTVLLLCC